MDCLDTALAYAERGKSVIPISKTAKTPLVPWKAFQSRIASEEEIRGWWDKYPEANVGLVTGALSNILVVDCDSPEATSRIQEILPEGLEVPLQQTPGGGRHFCFRHRPGYKNKARIDDHIDIRTEGGYIMLAPSSDSRGSWEWIGRNDIFVIEPPEIPPTLVPILQKEALRSDKLTTVDQTLQCSVALNPIKNTPYNTYKDLSIYREQKLEAQDLTIGSRNDTLFRMLMEDRRRGLSDVQVLESAMIYANSCKPRLSENEAKKIYFSAMRYELDTTGSETAHGVAQARLSDEEAQLELSDGAEIAQVGIKSQLSLWINEIGGSCPFTMREAYDAVGAHTPSEKGQIRNKLSSLCRDGKVKRLAGAGSSFRVVDSGVRFSDYKGVAAPTEVDLWFPLDIHKKGKIFQGNHIVLAGPTGKGKTTFILNMIQENMTKHRCYYYGSEMTAGELQAKIRFLNVPIEHWDMKLVVKKDWSYLNIVDKIAWDRDGIHFIDYLSPNDDKFYNIGKKMEECCDQLGKGVIIFSVQQNKPGESEWGLGGAFSAHGAVMYITLNYDKVKLTKVRFAEEDPNRLCNTREFSLGSRGIYYPKTDWYNPSAAKMIKKDYFEVSDD